MQVKISYFKGQTKKERRKERKKEIKNSDLREHHDESLTADDAFSTKIYRTMDEGESASKYDDDELPEHTQSMRQAAHYCVSGLSSLSPGPISMATNNGLPDDGIRRRDDASARARRRQLAYETFWAKDDASIPELRYADLSSPDDFRRQFHDLNVPCLVTFHSNQTRGGGDDCASPYGKSHWFSNVEYQWRLGAADKESKRPDGLTVNRKWFMETLGADAKVPVRFQPQDDTSTLDEEGRATECETKEISIGEWIQMLEEAEHSDAPATTIRNPYYLKDWHLLLQLQEQDDCCPPHQLYDCPPIFEFDLLNSFLTRFTKGDYRFCYWGPRGSFTSRHSDVLHSFSWSYNVIGTKKWTFFRRMGNEEMDDSSCLEQNKAITVIQKSGQAMFVPSQWQHEVVNMEETISINHNWVTSTNLNLCWDCLTTEMVAIEKELTAWGIHDDLEARESMLRGCVGLDVTSFFLMTLVRLSDLLTQQKAPRAENERLEEDPSLHSESAVEGQRLVQMMRVLQRDATLNLKGRLEGILQSKVLTSELLNTTDDLISQLLFVDYPKESI